MGVHFLSGRLLRTSPYLKIKVTIYWKKNGLRTAQHLALAHQYND